MCNRLIISILLLAAIPSVVISFSQRSHIRSRHKPKNDHVLWSTTMPSVVLGPRVPINENFPGLKKIYSNPDIFVIENFLDKSSCQDLIDRASEKKLERSPVAYAGWTEDFKELVELSSKGPVAWLALLSAWYQVKEGGSQVDLVVHALQNYAIVFIVSTMLIGGFTYSRAQGLKSLRTSTSTTLDDMTKASNGARDFVQRAANLFHSEEYDDQSSSFMQEEAALFEAPTVIRYEAGQILAPHYDANRSAETEDANRGGQTLATLLVYLNNVDEGGLTRFGKLSVSDAIPQTNYQFHNNGGDDKLVIRPRRGDALLFFPADRSGQFDPRTEHEGMAAVDEKWIARIWKHQRRVPSPFGLSESSLNDITIE